MRSFPGSRSMRLVASAAVMLQVTSNPSVQPLSPTEITDVEECCWYYPKRSGKSHTGIKKKARVHKGSPVDFLSSWNTLFVRVQSCRLSFRDWCTIHSFVTWKTGMTEKNMNYGRRCQGGVMTVWYNSMLFIAPVTYVCPFIFLYFVLLVRPYYLFVCVLIGE